MKFAVYKRLTEEFEKFINLASSNKMSRIKLFFFPVLFKSRDYK